MSFEHQQTAHCETGVTQGLLRQIGWEISEPMIFGIGSGIFFIHLPFVQVNGVPATSYRIWPGGIFNRTTSLLGVKTTTHTYNDSMKAELALDKFLDEGKILGAMASVYYLSYMPDSYRFHFNAHNMLIVGKSGNDYVISDPVLNDLKKIPSADLSKARFAKGYPAPKGKLYYINETGAKPMPDLTDAIRRGIRRTTFLINTSPLNFVGTTGINYLAKKIRKYPDKYEARKALLALGNIVRMQEEIGTGGGGFRFMYGAFLNEAAQLLNNSSLNEMSKRITLIGDEWRNFAFETAKVIKNRSEKVDSFDHLGDLLSKIGAEEVRFFKDLGKIKF